MNEAIAVPLLPFFNRSSSLPLLVGEVSRQGTFQSARLDVASESFAVFPMTGYAESSSMEECLPLLNRFLRSR